MTVIDLDNLFLDHGLHDSRDEGVCLLEAVAWFAGQEHTDHPRCVSPVLAAFGRRLNDLLPDGLRQELKPLIPLLPGTAGDGLDTRRIFLAVDWAVRTCLPAWLDLAGRAAEAAQLRGHEPVRDHATAEAIRLVVRKIHDKAPGKRAAAAAYAADAAAAAAYAAAADAAVGVGGDADADGDADGGVAQARLRLVAEQVHRSAIGLYARMIRCADDY